MLKLTSTCLPEIVIYSGGKDKALHVINSATGKLKLKKAGAHEYVFSWDFAICSRKVYPNIYPTLPHCFLSEPINALMAIGDNMVVSGDDGGVVKVTHLIAVFFFAFPRTILIYFHYFN
jgi:hypothetical protein